MQKQFPVKAIAAEKIAGEKDAALGIEGHKAAGRMGIRRFGKLQLAAGRKLILKF